MTAPLVSGISVSTLRPMALFAASSQFAVVCPSPSEGLGRSGDAGFLEFLREGDAGVYPQLHLDPVITASAPGFPRFLWSPHQLGSSLCDPVLASCWLCSKLAQ